MNNIYSRRVRSVILLLAIAALGGCVDEEVPPEQLVERARGALESGEVRAAFIDLKNALRATPNDADARLLLGQAYARSGDGASAQSELDRARELGIPEADLQPWLAQAQLLQGELEPLEALEIPDDAPPATRAELLRIRASALLAKDDAEGALGSARQALEIEPDSAAGLALMARIQARQGSLDEAAEAVNQALETDETLASAWMLLGDIEQSRGNLDAAEEAYTNAMEDPGLADGATLGRVSALMAMEQWDRAQADIDALRARDLKGPQIDFVDGLLQFRQQKFAEAAPLFEAVLGAVPGSQRALLLAGASRLALGNAGTAANYLSQYLAREPDDEAAQRLMAVAELRSGNAAEAQRLIEPIVNQSPTDAAALKTLSSALLQQGKTEEGVEYLARVKQSQPESAAPQAALGAVLFDQGDSAQGILELEQSLQKDPSLRGAAERVILGKARSGDLDGALEAAIENRDRNPDDVQALLLLAMVHKMRDEREESSQALLKALEIAPDDSATSAMIGAALAAEDEDWPKAKGYLQESLKHRPGNTAALLNLANIAEIQGERDEAIRYLQDAKAQAPEAITPRLRLARLYAQAQNPADSLAVLEPVRAAHPDNPDLLALAADAELKLERFADAKTTLEALRDLRPESPGIHEALARVDWALGDSEAARAGYEATLRLDPTRVAAVKGLATLAVQQNDPEDAESQLKRLRTLVDAGDPDLLRLQGAIAELTDDPLAAVAAYEKLVAANETTQNVMILARMQMKAGDTDAAVRSMRQWVEKHPEDAVVQFGLGMAYQQLQRPDDAIVWIERSLEAAPDNAGALNNLAWLLREREPAKALEYAERAYDLARDVPGVADTLAMVLLANGDAEKAAKVIERALGAAPDNGTFLFHQAKILEAAGEPAKARRALQKALEPEREFPERDAAQAMLRGLEAK